MTNQWGLDAHYFEEKLKLVVRDAGNYTPAEMMRELRRLADVAEAQIPSTERCGTVQEWNEVEAPIHIFPCDLEKAKTSECSLTVYSVPAGHPEKGKTVPLFEAPPK